MIRITLRKSAIGYSERQKLTVKALGLGKINSCTVKPDNPQIRGMVKKIGHLVGVERVDKHVLGGSESETE